MVIENIMNYKFVCVNFFLIDTLHTTWQHPLQTDPQLGTPFKCNNTNY